MPPRRTAEDLQRALASMFRIRAVELLVMDEDAASRNARLTRARAALATYDGEDEFILHLKTALG